MTIYECEECKFKSHNNYDYNKHLKTGKHLRNILPQKYTPNVTLLSPKCNPSVTLLSSPKKRKEIVVYECQYCDACFSHRQNRYRHEKNNCKAKKTSEENVVLQKEVLYLREKLDEALKRIGNTTNNNTTNNNNHSRNLNITINAYGKEDISYLKDQEWLKLLRLPENSITKLFLETHFNEEHPENSNIRLTNKNSKYLEVHDGEKWKNKPKKKMLSEIADDKQGVLDEKFSREDDLQNDMTERERNSHAYFHDESYYDNKREIVESLEGVLLDYKN